jgi:class 3 adenylate cyclase
MAQIVDEIAIASAKALAMDVIYSEPEPIRYEEVQPPSADSAGGMVAAPSTAPATAPSSAPAHTGGVVAARRAHDDATFAAALARFGHAIIPVSLNLSLEQPSSPIYRALVAELFDGIERDRDQIIDALRNKGHREPELAASVNAHFLNARREAMYQRIAAEIKGGDPTLEELRRRILPKTDPQIAGSPLLRLLEASCARYQAIRSLRRFARPVTDDLPPLITTRDEQATLRRFSQAAASTGFVDYVPLADGIVRTVPLWANHRDFIFPQMGLSLACAMLDVKLSDVRIAADHILIPRPGAAAVVIPVRTQATPRGRFGMFLDIPWFGTDDWQTMYDYPEHKRSRQHMPIHFVWEACEIRHRIATNNASMDSALIFIIDQIDRGKAEELIDRPFDPNDADSRIALAEKVLQKLKRDGTVELYQSFKPQEMTPGERIIREKMIHQPDALRQLIEQNKALQADLARRRAALRQQLEGRAVLIGWIAVGAIADNIPTSLHPRCPGVVVHGVIFNSVMTGEFWHAAPRWITLLLTGLLGLLATLIVARLAAWKALAAAAVLALGYMLFNGLYLFDCHNQILGVAGPLTAVGAVWAGGTLARYILEASERARVTSRFRNYVDPELVSFVLESDNPRLDGQEKEALTVVFTDLAGFTTISEQLKERTVPLLNEYMGLMVPIIRKHRGYLNKFLGDGIMYFFGAPRDNPSHAINAVASVLEMQEVMVAFNQSLLQRGLPSLAVRAGVSSGKMVVGDAGPAGIAHDYTVLGDAVNLGARLESANKAFGSRILVNARVRGLVADQAVFRPIGKIQVKGKREGVMTFEALCLADNADGQHRRIADLTTQMVDSFMAGQFERCLQAVKRLEEAFGPSKLTELYADLSQQYLRNPPAAFDGQIVLTEK